MTLKEYMDFTGKSLTQVAQELGISKQLVFQWKNGSRPRPENALKVEKWSKGAVRKDKTSKAVTLTKRQ